MPDASDQPPAAPPPPEEKGGARFVVMLQGGADRRGQYFTGKALAEFWKSPNLQEILDRLRTQENVILHKAATREEADEIAARFAALGARTWVVEQRQIAGLKVF